MQTTARSESWQHSILDFKPDAAPGDGNRKRGYPGVLSWGGKLVIR